MTEIAYMHVHGVMEAETEQTGGKTELATLTHSRKISHRAGKWRERERESEREREGERGGRERGEGGRVAGCRGGARPHAPASSRDNSCRRM